ncbi:MAG: hypothetical protein HOP33_10130 [Verrucomicrobia bacterium]|nr:hypothetical protein [Verrucomicrobiota bacterium]
MNTPKIEPHRITTPIQLMAVWFAGLVILVMVFIGGAAYVTTPTWIAGMLTIAAVTCVPVFLFCVFLLQTAFRPQLQEDKYYSDWLAQNQQKAQSTTSSPLPPQTPQTLSATPAPTAELPEESKRILRTLWRYQTQSFGADISKRWTFGVHPFSPDYSAFLRGLAPAVSRGLVAVSPENYQCMLTNEGISFLKTQNDLQSGDDIYKF